VERLDGRAIADEDKHVPNRLVARNSWGEEVWMTVLIKTKGSDTKLVAQMQPYHEAKTRGRRKIGNVDIPCCVTQIADGENGGVMMNEFPRDFAPLWRRIKSENFPENSAAVVGFNGSEYIELIESAGLRTENYPVCQAQQQHKIWEKIRTEVSPEIVANIISELKISDEKFHLDGSSWTSNLSWVRGYENVLDPINQLSQKFHEKFPNLVHGQNNGVTENVKFREALLHLMLLETSCFRYWGQGTWTEYGKEIFQRGMKILEEV